jgi:hypothetical protein
MICPKCQFEQPDTNTCVHCGVIFAKYQASLDRQNKSNDENNIESEESDLINKTPNHFAGLNHPWKPVATPTFIFLSLLFCLHGVFFPKTTQIEDWSLFAGLIHNVNLVFHEAGHVLFGLFGNNTLMVLGGSLNQLLIPFIAFSAFFYKRDRAGAAFALLWFFGNFIDVSIYMADGRFLKLPLIGGLGMEAHDWRNLFNHFDLWGIDQMLSNMVFFLGWAGIFLAWVWLCKGWGSDLKRGRPEYSFGNKKN